MGVELNSVVGTITVCDASKRKPKHSASQNCHRNMFARGQKGTRSHSTIQDVAIIRP